MIVRFRLLLTFLILVLGSGQSFSRSLEMQMNEAVWTQIRDRFSADDFEFLENLSIKLRNDKTMSPSGLPNGRFFYAALKDVFRVDLLKDTNNMNLGQKRVEEKLARWTNKYPESAAAIILRNAIRVDRVYLKIPVGRSIENILIQRPDLEEELDRAKKDLLKHKSIASVDPQWYVLMLNIQYYKPDKNFSASALAEEAINKFPLYYDIYFALRSLTPSGIREGTLDAFARAYMPKTKKMIGNSLYARIIWDAAYKEYGDRIFQDTSARWDLMRISFEDIIKQYPDELNIENYAKFACLARDREKTYELMQKSEPLLTAWSSREMRASCYNWSKKGHEHSQGFSP